MNSFEVERRSWPRMPASALEHWSAALMTGPAVSVVNLSRNGASLESTVHFPARSTIHLRITPPSGPRIVTEAEVIWSTIASLSGGKIVYGLGIMFAQLLPEIPETQPADPCVAEELPRPADSAWEEERSLLVQQIDDAAAAMDALQAELVTANDREARYQELVAQLSAERDELRCRAERSEAEAARWRASVQQLEAAADARRQELKGRLDAAVAICVAYDSRYAALRHETRKLVSMLNAPPEPEFPAPAIERQESPIEGTLQAVL